MLRLLLPCLLILGEAGEATPIRRDETVVLFPGLARRVDAGSWEIRIHGWVFERERHGVALAVFRKALGIDESELTPAEKEIFTSRAGPFLVDNERRKRIFIRLCGRDYNVGPTGADGHVTARIRIPASLVDPSIETFADKRRIALHTIADDPNVPTVSGEVYLLEPTGISVISDIDDTIKVSEVADRKALLRNTFLKPFEPVDGMAAVYRLWSTETKAEFHYVTASPWQLYPALSEFIRSNRFPAGTFDMKSFRWKDRRFLNLFKSPETYKRRVIEPILNAFPQRRFVLVGDSGERDPEIYGALAREHPDQVARILIRDVTGEDSGDARYRKAFKGVPSERWQVFRNAQEIEGALRGVASG